MKLLLNREITEKYHSASQKIRVSTEYWVNSEIFCPSCGMTLTKYGNNRPVADFLCSNCSEEYELKSKKNVIGNKIVDGAYKTMMQRLRGENIPNLFILNYDQTDYRISNFLVIPKHFFVTDIIEKRKALSEDARRAGWVGCNILLGGIPLSGKIFYVKNGDIAPKDKVIEEWHKTIFLRDKDENISKGWLLDIMSCIDKVDKQEFTLNDIYAFETRLAAKYPDNRHVKDKIRQQLQILRDKGYLKFTSRGQYKVGR
jgi:type II restriction enzyme